MPGHLVPPPLRSQAHRGLRSVLWELSPNLGFAPIRSCCWKRSPGPVFKGAQGGGRSREAAQAGGQGGGPGAGAEPGAGLAETGSQRRSGRRAGGGRGRPAARRVCVTCCRPRRLFRALLGYRPRVLKDGCPPGLPLAETPAGLLGGVVRGRPPRPVYHRSRPRLTSDPGVEAGTPPPTSSRRWPRPGIGPQLQRRGGCRGGAEPSPHFPGPSMRKAPEGPAGSLLGGMQGVGRGRGSHPGPPWTGALRPLGSVDRAWTCFVFPGSTPQSPLPALCGVFG